MTWSGFLQALDIAPTGFSIAILSQGAFAIAMKKSMAAWRSALRFGYLGCGRRCSTGRCLSSGW